MEKQIRELLESLEIDKEILSEKTIKKMALIFEASVNKKVTKIETKLEEQNDEALEEFKGEMVDKLDEYMNYFATEYIAENKDSIEDAVVVKTAKSVLDKFDGMVNEFNMSLDEDNLDKDEEIDDLKEQLNSHVNKSIDLENKLEESVKSQMISEVSSNIETESEKDAFIALAENFEFEDGDSYKEKLNFLKENINTSTEEVETLEESETENTDTVLEEGDENNNPMTKYLKVYKRA